MVDKFQKAEASVFGLVFCLSVNDDLFQTVCIKIICTPNSMTFHVLNRICPFLSKIAKHKTRCCILFP